MTITEQTLVSDIATTIPSSVGIFQRVGIDFCCGGKKALAVACEEQRLSFADVAREIEALAAKRRSEERDWTTAPLGELADHIVSTYHDRLQEDLPRLEEMAARVLRVHGGKAPRLLGRLEAIVEALSNDLHAHMRKEELVLFPAIRTVASGATQVPIPIAQAIAVMEKEHDGAGVLLAELRALTNGYAAPEWACGTCLALYSGLEALERDMHVHVHLENNILFPRALRSAGLEASAVPA